MDKFSVDYEALGGTMSQRKVYRFEDVKDRLVKVAFDIVRFRDNDSIDGLWQIQETNDGEVIVAMYEEEPENGLESKSSDWSAVADKTGHSVNIFYKNEPVTKIASFKVNLPPGEAGLLVEFLPEKLETNAELRSALINELSSDDKESLLAKFPELK